MEQRRWVLATLVAVFAVLDGGAIWAMPYGVMFERDTDGQSGNELAFITAPTLGDLVDNSNLTSQFSDINVNAAFSTTGVTWDGSQYGVMFERDTDGQSGNELAFITAPTLGDLVDNSNLTSQFSDINVNAAFSTTGLYSELSSSPPVSSVPEPDSFLLFSVGIVIVVLQLPVARRTRFV
jgi:hypothetical protein